MKVRTLHFPSSRSLGKLFSYDKESRSGWVEFAEAQGDVNAPPGAELRIVVSPEKPIDLSAFSDLGPGDIQEFELVCTSFDESELQYIQHLKGLRCLSIWETNVSDAGLVYISRLPALEWLDIGDTNITDHGLELISRLVSLRGLSLLNNKITDKGAIFLMPLLKLEYLDLMGTTINDASIAILTSLKSLKSLRIYDTAISNAGYTAIKNALPGCQIMYEDPHVP